MESRAGFLGGGVWSHGRVALPPRIATASQRAGPWAAGAVQPPSFVFLCFPSCFRCVMCEALEIRVVDSVGLLRWRSARTARRRRPVRADKAAFS